MGVIFCNSEKDSDENEKFLPKMRHIQMTSHCDLSSKKVQGSCPNLWPAKWRRSVSLALTVRITQF